VSAFTSRPYAGEADLDLLIEFARQTAIARRPRAAYWYPGDIVWQAFTPNFDPRTHIQLWFDDIGLAAHAWFEPPLNVEFDVRNDLREVEALAGEILDWAEGRRVAELEPAEDVPKAYAMLGDGTLATSALESDPARVAMLERRGYVKNDRHNVCYSLSLEAPIAAPQLPPGAKLRYATEADLDERIELHRDAWSVWGPSSQNVADYRRLRAAPLYDETLDVVLELDGRLVAYCICWADPASGIGNFEPAGVRPGLTGRGLGRAVIFEGLRRLRERGLHTACVGTASVNARAGVLYESCGFGLIDRGWYYTKAMH
jgi:ribosomal protein S18 acetylase RimI-like enzyme